MSGPESRKNTINPETLKKRARILIYFSLALIAFGTYEQSRNPGEGALGSIFNSDALNIHFLTFAGLVALGLGIYALGKSKKT